MSDPTTTRPEDCPTPAFHETHHYCPSCTWTNPDAPRSDRPRLDVHEVPRGSVVVLTGAQLETTDVASMLVEEIGRVTGHQDFALLVLGAGAVEVWGPNDDLAAKVAALLPREVRHERHATPQVQAPQGHIDSPVVGGPFLGGRDQDAFPERYT